MALQLADSITPSVADGTLPPQNEAGGWRAPPPVRWAIVFAAGCLVAYAVWVLVHPTGFYSVPVDGWGIDVLELALCALCVARVFEPTWRASTAVARAVPVVLGVACLSWAV